MVSIQPARKARIASGLPAMKRFEANIAPEPTLPRNVETGATSLPSWVSSNARNSAVVLIAASTSLVRSAERIGAGPPPIATVFTPFGPQPDLSASCRPDQSLNEPELETPIVLPFRSSSVLIGESQGAPTPRKGAGPVLWQT